MVCIRNSICANIVLMTAFLVHVWIVSYKKGFFSPIKAKTTFSELHLIKTDRRPMTEQELLSRMLFSYQSSKKNWKCNNVHHSRLRKPRCSINHCFYVYWGHISLNNKKSDTVIAADTSDPFLSSYLLTMTCLLSQFCTQSHQKQALRCLI